jgi:hypothetical protein
MFIGSLIVVYWLDELVMFPYIAVRYAARVTCCSTNIGLTFPASALQGGPEHPGEQRRLLCQLVLESLPVKLQIKHTQLFLWSAAAAGTSATDCVTVLCVHWAIYGSKVLRGLLATHSMCGACIGEQLHP